MGSNKISVVMTTYNGERFVADQLLSIINQTRCPDEILIFDDGSKDSTESIINDLSVSHPGCNILYHKNSVNKGWQKNFIDGITQASGDIIFLADQDDVWKIDKIEEMSKIIESDKNIDVLVSNFKVLNMRGTSTPELMQEASMLNDECVEKISIDYKFYAVARPGCTFCFRKVFFEEICSAWVKNLAHDQLLWTAAILKKTLYIYKKPLISFRRHDSNASGIVTLNVSAEKRVGGVNNNIHLVQSMYDRYKEYLNKNEKQIVNDYLGYEVSRKKLLCEKSLIAFIKLLLKYPQYRYSIKSNIKDLYVAFK